MGPGSVVCGQLEPPPTCADDVTPDDSISGVGPAPSPATSAGQKDRDRSKVLSSIMDQMRPLPMSGLSGAEKKKKKKRKGHTDDSESEDEKSVEPPKPKASHVKTRLSPNLFSGLYFHCPLTGGISRAKGQKGSRQDHPRARFLQILYIYTCPPANFRICF